MVRLISVQVRGTSGVVSIGPDLLYNFLLTELANTDSKASEL